MPMVSQVRLLLDVSWNEILQSLRLLRSTLGDGVSYVDLLLFIQYTGVSEELHPGPATYKNLARAFMKLTRRFASGDLPSHMCTEMRAMKFLCRPLDLLCNRNLCCYNWGRLVRLSPPSLDLLGDLGEVDLPNNSNFPFHKATSRFIDPRLQNPVEIHNVIHWLKASPEPPQDILELWEGYLRVSTTAYGQYQTSSDRHPESRWNDWLRFETDFSRVCEEMLDSSRRFEWDDFPSDNEYIP
ncbi:hypothetical protein C8R46DRAFT_257830 [Mycena filopes]|nr:hypothetical protein C8R46DRAFT_257830 [Mycena filopes]